MANDQVKAGYVLGSNDKIYVQVPADNQWGFEICDENESWPGGVNSGLKSWTLLSRDDERITNDDRSRLDWVLDEWIEENRPAVEVCSNVEWVRENDLDKDGIDESDLDDAARDYASEVFRGLRNAAFLVTWPQGHRILCHGWNGARFASKQGCVGSFETLTKEQLEVISAVRIEAQKKISEAWKSDKQGFAFKTDAESGEIYADDFEDAQEQLRKMFSEAALADGAWGWVEDLDGDRFEIGIQPGRVAGL